MANERTILITGATGQQGGAVARALIGRGFDLRGMTRKPDGEAAQALAAAGVKLVAGDLDDAAALAKAVEGAWGVFSVQNTWEAGVLREEEQGKRLAQVAKDKGVQHFVYTSVGSADKKTGIPHFDNKWRVEEKVRSLGFASHVILRPVFFMENLVSPWFLNGDTLAAGMRPETVLQMIAVEDIGRIGAQAFINAAELNRAELEIAGDAATIPAAAEILSRASGKPVKFFQVPIAEVRKNSDDFATMLEWFDSTGYSANIADLEKKFGKLTKLSAWAQKKLGG
ncbi:MAG: NmrA/HSCARG family protein [Myxococcales bacterium]|nr:NmrA/HSCARG family protein [Myxococcales bacterium]